jgi:putative ABC transport system permease protein
MGTMLNDLRHALRLLRRSPGFTSVSVLTLALAIGATTAIFSVVYGVLLKPLPYSHSERIMAVFEITTKGTWNNLADPNFDDFRDQSSTFQTIAKYSAYAVSVSGGSQPTRSMVARVTPQFLRVFRVQPVIGRDFVPSDNTKGAVR